MIKKWYALNIVVFIVVVLTATFLNYSFNTINYIEEGNTLVSFSCQTSDELKCVNDIQNVMKEYEVDVYFKDQNARKITYYDYGNSDSITSEESGYSDFFFQMSVEPISNASSLNLSNGYLIVSGKDTTQFINELGDTISVETTTVILKQKSEFFITFLPLIIISITILLITSSVFVKKQRSKLITLYMEGYNKYHAIIIIFKPILILSCALLSVICLLSLLMSKLMFVNFLVASLGIIALVLVIMYISVVINNIDIVKNEKYSKVELLLIRLFKYITITFIIVLSMSTININNKIENETQNLVIYEQFENYYYYQVIDDGFFQNDNYDQLAYQYQQLYLNTVDLYHGIFTIPLIPVNIEEGSNVPILTTEYYLDIINLKNTDGEQITSSDVIDDNINIITTEKYYEENKEKLNENYTYNIILTDNIDNYIWDMNFNMIPVNSDAIIIFNDYLAPKMEELENNVFYIMQCYIMQIPSNEPYNELYPILEEINLDGQIKDLNKFNEFGMKQLNNLEQKKQTKIILWLITFMVCTFFIICETYIYFMKNGKKIILMQSEGYTFYDINRKNIYISLIIYAVALFSAFSHTHLMFITIIPLLILLMSVEYVTAKIIYTRLTNKYKINILKGDI